MRRGAICAAAAGLAIGGCGDDDATTPPVRSAVVAAAERTTAHRELVNQTTFVRTSDHDYVEITVIGYVDGSDRTGSLVVATRRKGHGRPSAAGRRLEKLDGFVIHDGPRTYQRYFAFNRRVGLKMTRWVLIDPASRAGRKLDFSRDALTGALDPTLPVDELRAVVRDYRVVTRGDGAGREHHRVSVDLERYARIAPPPARATVRAAVRRYRKLIGTTLLPEDVWIDGSGRIAMVKASVSPSAGPPTLSWVLSLRPTNAHVRIPANAVPLRKLAHR